MPEVTSPKQEETTPEQEVDDSKVNPYKSYQLDLEMIICGTNQLLALGGW